MRRLLWPGISSLIALLILLALGTWQLQRLHWKERILARIAAAEAAPPVPLPTTPSEFMKVTVSGVLRHDLGAHYGAEVRDTRQGPQLGSYLIEPLQRPDAPPLLVERGWVPQKPVTPIAEPTGTIAVTGYVHPPERAGWFSASDDPVSRTFYTLDPQAIAESLGLPRVEPFVLIAIGDAPREYWPDPARHLPRPPNNHLQYAITWYGLAVALVVIFVIWSRRTLRT